MNIKHRLKYLVTGTVTLMFMGLIYAWSLFRVPLGSMFPGWSVSQLSLTFTISMIFFCLGGFVIGLVSKWISFRLKMIIAGVILFAGFFAASLMDPNSPGKSLVLIYLFYGVFGGTGVGIAYNSMLSAVNRWFPDRIGLASGIMLMGFGIGGLALGSAVDMMISSIGVLRVFRLLGVIIAAVCVLAAVIIKMPGEGDEAVLAEPSLKTQNRGKRNEPDAYSKDHTPARMLKTSKFWYFLIWCVLLDATGLLVINSAAEISIAYGGTAVLGMIVSLFNGAGRIYAGSNYDRRGRKIANFINNTFVLAAGVLLTLGAVTNGYVFILLGLIFVGMAFGGGPTIASAFLSRTFGRKYYSMNLGVINFSVIPGATIGPMLSSALIESAGGAYDTSFYTIIGFAVAGYICLLLLERAMAKD